MKYQKEHLQKNIVKYVESVIPDYDRDRVYPNDIKRIVDWYNIVVNAGITEFVEK